eukprot:CAMPEP_0194060980 /NCGR_PEP_ID=MMETSP0009_2-20130614/73318_1 /TAXON_ID=210454 /ORGANISM="Grammatophora oceanica, Strain CCMP 410" /LENGTH=50 /DNA_ID=CAMNT_0038712101 /DNA_START=1 /DNA_END=153 /DNA_ORIENTATION=+
MSLNTLLVFGRKKRNASSLNKLPSSNRHDIGGFETIPDFKPFNIMTTGYV